MTGGKLPFTSLNDTEGSPVLPGGLAVCFGRPCLFETTIALLPNEIQQSCERAQGILDLEGHNLRVFGDDKMHYLSYPPSFAVDGNPDTAFRSIRGIFSLSYLIASFQLLIRCSSRRYNISGHATGHLRTLLSHADHIIGR